MTAFLLPTLLLLANITGVGMIVPQVARLRSLKITDGVSAPWVGVGLVMNSWWTAYSIQEELWGVAPVSTFTFVLYGVISWQIFRIDGPTIVPKLLSGITTFGIIPIPFLFLGGWQTAGLAIGSLYGGQFLLALLSTYRSTSTRGVSPTTWILANTEALIWCYYGAAISDGALLIGGGGGALVSAGILLRLFSQHRSNTARLNTANHP